MTKYINREEFIQHIEESDLPDMAKRAVIALVRHMPAADVVEVVRCKDCKHSWFNGTSLWLCQREGKFYCPKVTENAFCSYGERKEADG